MMFTLNGHVDIGLRDTQVPTNISKLDFPTSQSVNYHVCQVSSASSCNSYVYNGTLKRQQKRSLRHMMSGASIAYAKETTASRRVVPRLSF